MLLSLVTESEKGRGPDSRQVNSNRSNGAVTTVLKVAIS